MITSRDLNEHAIPDHVLPPGRMHWLDAFNHVVKLLHIERRPTIVVLCGSMRFHDAFVRANYEETLAGRIVLSVGFAPGPEHGEGVGITPEQKKALDELYFRKIELADEVLVLNVGGYIGESTSREIAYARSLARPIRYLETPA